MHIPRHPIQAARTRLADPHYLFGRNLPNNPIVLEAGAHLGEDTVGLAARWPNGRIHAFEPVPTNYSQLAAAVAGLPNVTAYQLALSDRDGTDTIYLGGPSSSLLKPTGHLDAYPQVEFTGVTEVATTTIAAWATTNRIDRIDAMRLDMQGKELAALQHAGSVLSTTRAIILEVCKVELYDGCPLWPDVRAWLKNQGFRIRALKWHASGNYGDALAIKAKR